MDGMDKAAEILAETLTRRVVELDDLSERRRQGLQELMEEKFRGVSAHIAERDHTIKQQFTDSYTGVSLRFQERDTRSEREARDNKTAVDAAFAAQKEAVAEQNKSIALANDKSEASFTKQIDQLVVLIQTTNKAIDDKINDLKTRQDQGAGRSGGFRDAGQITYYVFAIAIAIAAVIIAHLIP